MKKNFNFTGLYRLGIPKCNILCNSEYNSLGEQTHSLMVQVDNNENIHYKNDKSIGVIPDTTNKDVLSAFMEINPNGPTNELVEFFTNYGFFFAHSGFEDNLYIRYLESDVRNFIDRIQHLISLYNQYIKYIDYVEKSTDGYNMQNPISFSQLCTEFLRFHFRGIDSLYGIQDTDENVINEKEYSNYIAGNSMIIKYLSLCQSNDSSISLYYENISQDDLASKYSFINRQLTKDELRNPFFTFILKTFSIDKNSAPKLLNSISEYESELIQFCVNLLNLEKFNSNIPLNKITNYQYEIDDRYNIISLSIPDVINLDDSDDITVSLQKSLIKLVAYEINTEINQNIRNIHPLLYEISFSEGKNYSFVSWHFKNLLDVLFMELVSLRNNRIECRACCKPDCPVKGKYYFLANVTDLQSTCYDKKCRIRINKKNFDAKHK